MDLSMLSVLSMGCGLSAAIVAALLIYRAVLSTKEEDRLFLNAEANRMTRKSSCSCNRG